MSLWQSYFRLLKSDRQKGEQQLLEQAIRGAKRAKLTQQQVEQLLQQIPDRKALLKAIRDDEFISKIRAKSLLADIPQLTFQQKKKLFKTMSVSQIKKKLQQYRKIEPIFDAQEFVWWVQHPNIKKSDVGPDDMRIVQIFPRIDAEGLQKLRLIAQEVPDINFNDENVRQILEQLYHKSQSKLIRRLKIYYHHLPVTFGDDKVSIFEPHEIQKRQKREKKLQKIQADLLDSLRKCYIYKHLNYLDKTRTEIRKTKQFLQGLGIPQDQLSNFIENLDIQSIIPQNIIHFNDSQLREFIATIQTPLRQRLHSKLAQFFSSHQN